jgi:hypothetical protein
METVDNTIKPSDEFSQGVDYALHILRELGVPVDELLKELK